MKWYVVAETLLFLFFIVYLVGGTFLFTARGYGFATVKGTSMYPTLKNGTRIIIKWGLPEGNLTGKIIIFSSNPYICHRCVLDEGDWLSFKGDNSETIERATRDEIRGEFVKVCNNPFDVPTIGWFR